MLRVAVILYRDIWYGFEYECIYQYPAVLWLPCSSNHNCYSRKLSREKTFKTKFAISTATHESFLREI